MTPGTPAAGARQTANLSFLLTATSWRLPDGTALVHGDTRWSWRDLDDRVSALAARFTALGVRAGDCVLLDGPNHPEFVQAMFATWRVGAVLAPVNMRLHVDDVVRVAAVCRPVLVVAHASTGTHADAVLAAGHAGCGVLWIDQQGPDGIGATAPAPTVRDHRVRVGQAAWFFFTSGTSGSPKCAVLTHDQLDYVLTNHLADLMPTTAAGDGSLVVAPLSHGAGVHLLPQVARGATSVIPVSASLDPAEVWQLVERERVANVFTVPTILSRLVDHPAVHAHDHSSLRYVVYAGAPMAGPDRQRARDVLGDVLVQYYGLGEVTGTITVLPPGEHDHPSPAGIDFGTCGRPRVGMQISVQDDEGTELPPLATGEVCVAGPGVCAGYLDDEAATAAAFRDGWFRTGDIGLLDESGYLYLTGRLSDMYISGGSNIHPREVEEKLATHPGIAEVVVLGMPDPVWGEVGAAVCVRTPGHDLDAEDVRGWLSTRMARYKIPRHVVFWDDIPRSGYGKVVRRTVRSMLVDAGWTDEGPGREESG